MPRTPEELRRRYRLKKYHWQIIAIKLPGRAQLKGLDGEFWDGHVEWLLSKEVAGLSHCGADTKVVAAPDWDTLLNYDYEVNRVAFKAANKGTPLKDVMLGARKDTPTGATAPLTAVQAAIASIKSNKGNNPTPDPYRWATVPAHPKTAIQ